jgi:hypothetical protein
VKQARRATYADVEAVPPNEVAELIGGTLHVMPRPAPRHARASSMLGVEFGGPFDKGQGGPGGRKRWGSPTIHRGKARVRVVPFDAIELDLSALWATSS